MYVIPELVDPIVLRLTHFYFYTLRTEGYSKYVISASDDIILSFGNWLLKWNFKY